MPSIVSYQYGDKCIADFTIASCGSRRTFVTLAELATSKHRHLCAAAVLNAEVEPEHEVGWPVIDNTNYPLQDSIRFNEKHRRMKLYFHEYRVLRVKGSHLRLITAT
jgi:hypothetical protein